MKKINYFEINKNFISQCEINYRLSILDNADDWYLYENKNLLYKNDSLFVYTDEEILFSNYMTTKQFNILNVTPEIIKQIILKREYLLCIFDTYYCKYNINFRKLHNINTVLIYEFNSNSFFCYLNIGIQGSKTIIIKYEELIEMFVWDVKIINQYHKQYNYIGLPYSIVKLKKEKLGYNKNSLLNLQ